MLRIGPYIPDGSSLQGKDGIVVRLNFNQPKNNGMFAVHMAEQRGNWNFTLVKATNIQVINNITDYDLENYYNLKDKTKVVTDGSS